MLVRLVTPRARAASIVGIGKDNLKRWFRFSDTSSNRTKKPAGRVVLDPIVEHTTQSLSSRSPLHNCIQSVTSQDDNFLNHFVKKKKNQYVACWWRTIANTTIFWFMYLRVQKFWMKNRNLFYKTSNMIFAKYWICTQSIITKKSVKKTNQIIFNCNQFFL